jgi:UDP-N-acetylmuramoyl-tripeptide--D-alanyl-D-alanine ligase
VKKVLKKIITGLLRIRVKKLLKKNKTEIFGITGSVGKTTAKNALALVLGIKYRVLASSQGFNTEIGLLLTLLQEKESGFSSPFKWLGILGRAYFTKQEIPQIVVLEYGVDAPGDMTDLLKIIEPHYAIVTKIAAVHLGPGQFADIEGIAQEKEKLVKAASKIVVLNGNCKYTKRMQPRPGVCRLTFGVRDDGLMVRSLKDELTGFSFNIKLEAERYHFHLPVYGSFLYSSVVPAIILGIEKGIEPKKIVKALHKFTTPPGRGRILKGLGGSTIWDSSYNASPEAVLRSLETLEKIPALRKIALLGNMNELGEQSTKWHKKIGRKAAEIADEIHFVGEEAESFTEGVVSHNAEKKPQIHASAEEAGIALAQTLKDQDLILVKGSQNNVRLERAVEKILARGEDERLLCRRGWGG